MGHSILIVDDDQIFNALLSDVFRQAGYDVRSAFSADEAKAALKAGAADLVVTDQRMPGTSGTQLVKHIVAEYPGLPVVMVSGFLSNDDIRQLIASGIGGVFIKPLNIFQLLKRASQLIDKAGSPAAPAGADSSSKAAKDEPAAAKTLGGARGAVATRLIKQLESLRGFSGSLIAVGPQGTDFETICDELADRDADSVFFLDPRELDDCPRLASRLAGLVTGANGRTTIVFDGVGDIDQSRAQAIMSLSRAKEPFDRLGQPVRFVFCLEKPLDELFDAGLVDENLYLFMGTNELRVPALTEMREDIPAIASGILASIPGAAKRIDAPACALLKALDWPGGMKQLRQVLCSAGAEGAVVGEHSLRDAYEGRNVRSQGKASVGFAEHMQRSQEQYVRAMLVIFGGQTPLAACALGVSTDKMGERSSHAR
jgi:two-component system response regulator AtoC